MFGGRRLRLGGGLVEVVYRRVRRMRTRVRRFLRFSVVSRWVLGFLYFGLLGGMGRGVVGLGSLQVLTWFYYEGVGFFGGVSCGEPGCEGKEKKDNIKRTAVKRKARRFQSQNHIFARHFTFAFSKSYLSPPHDATKKMRCGCMVKKAGKQQNSKE